MITDPAIAKKERLNSFLKEFRKNLAEGAQTLGNISVDIYGDMKEKAEDLHERGSEKFEQASGVIHDYIDKYKGEQEIKNLIKKKNDLNAKVGAVVFREFKKNGTLSKSFLNTKKMISLFTNIENVDRDILRFGRELELKKT